MGIDTIKWLAVRKEDHLYDLLVSTLKNKNISRYQMGR